ncbi:MAG: permease [Spirochaetes bacterium]|nr:permease [Spirochaetota bacterium]
MRKIIKNNIIIIIALFAYALTSVINFNVFLKALHLTLQFLKEMIEVLPPVLILSGLITVWIPKESIIKIFGDGSGIKGKIISLFIGSFSAGPIYAAFPVCRTLLNKGATISNIVIILSSWAVVKVPMFLVEAKFLGVSFAALRYFFTIPVIFLMGFLLEKKLSRAQILSVTTQEQSNQVLEQLPGYNCKACGFSSCIDFSIAVADNQLQIKNCLHLK